MTFTVDPAKEEAYRAVVAQQKAASQEVREAQRKAERAAYVSRHRAVLPTGDQWRRDLAGCNVLGGYGYPLPVGEPLAVTFDPSGVSFATDYGQTVPIPLADLTDIEIGGPGKVTEGGGFIGGGFGLEGAATGMLIAGVLTALSTKTTILTVVALTTTAGEVWFAYTQSEPAALRVELSPVFVAIRRTGTLPNR